MSIVRVEDVMVRNPVKVGLLTPVREVARLMRERAISSVILAKDERPVGIITERDLVWRVLAAGKDPEALTAFDICSKPVVATSGLMEVEEAVDIMRKNRIRRIVVVDNRDKVAGILTTDDLGYRLKSMSEDLAIKYMMMLRREKTQP